ncbi:hypothetical protein BgiBS90_023217 [Biomphalaria glabrata]|nr:hypothetical protein BgiBS90_023217 [Biomphalaria glabrata]
MSLVFTTVFFSSLVTSKSVVNTVSPIKISEQKLDLINNNSVECLRLQCDHHSLCSEESVQLNDKLWNLELTKNEDLDVSSVNKWCRTSSRIFIGELNTENVSSLAVQSLNTESKRCNLCLCLPTNLTNITRSTNSYSDLAKNGSCDRDICASVCLNSTDSSIMFSDESYCFVLDVSTSCRFCCLSVDSGRSEKLSILVIVIPACLILCFICLALICGLVGCRKTSHQTLPVQLVITARNEPEYTVNMSESRELLKCQRQCPEVETTF